MYKTNVKRSCQIWAKRYFVHERSWFRSVAAKTPQLEVPEERVLGTDKRQQTPESSRDNNKTSMSSLPLGSMPGPKGFRKIPYLGTAFLFKPFTEYTPETFGRLMTSMHEKYGHVFKIRLGKDYSVCTDSVKDAETIFRKEDSFPKRRLMSLSKVYRERNGLPPALGTVSGPDWYELRSPLNPLLNRPQVCLHYLPALNQVADDFVSRLSAERFSPLEISEEFFKYAAESIGVVCFNHRLGFLDPDLSNTPERIRLLESFKTALHCTFMAMIGLERKYLKTADDPFYRKYEESMKFIRRQSMVHVEKVIAGLTSQGHGTKGNNGDAAQRLNLRQETMTSSIRADRESNLLASMISNGKLEMEKILAIIDSMLIAGTDSTARNLAILFYNFARHPETQQKAAKEVIGLIGRDGQVTAESLAKMNYLKACVKESMRLNFPLANGTERILSRDTILSGYLVPKGTSVIMSSSRSSLDSTNFHQPEKFLPNRWLRQSSQPDLGNHKPAAFACLPFGHGARGCIGRRFAEMEIYVGTAKILQKLKIQVAPSYPGLDSIYTPFITPKNPIPFIFTRHW